MPKRASSCPTVAMRGCTPPASRQPVPSKSSSSKPAKPPNKPSRTDIKPLSRSGPPPRLPPADMTSPFRRTARLSVDELCAAYGNEDVHTEHVTALALCLFDRTRVALGLPAAARRLLEAAARLHDVGYSVDPVHHVPAGAEIVLGKGIKGFSGPECEQISQIMVHHSGKVSASGAPTRLLQLAAFLRIGDGLDYSHAQTAKIVGVRRVRRTIFVTVRSDRFPESLARADRKADLWRAVFPYDIQLVAAPVPKQNREPLVRAAVRVIEAV